MRAAIRTRSARRFGTAQVLDPGAVKKAGAPGEIGVGMAADGTATVAWSASVRGGPAPARALRATAARAGRGFVAVQTVSVQVAYGGLGDVAVAPSGAALLTWATYGPDPAIMAAVRQPGATSARRAERVARVRTSAFDGVDPTPDGDIDDAGTASVVWASERIAGSVPLHVPMSAVVLLATRPAGTG